MTTENREIFNSRVPVEVILVDPFEREKRSLESKRLLLGIKRLFDISFSTLCLAISTPLWVIIPLLIWFEDRGPVFYRQERVGKNQNRFTILKFRSMIPNAESIGSAVMARSNDPRITRTGLLLRKTALDELPQLLSIWKGDMSFVGPRALRDKEKIVSDEGEILLDMSEIEGFRIRQLVQPGLTGMAQVYAERDLHHRYKFKYDLLYIRKMSFWLDMKLIAMSFWYTFSAKWHV